MSNLLPAWPLLFTFDIDGLTLVAALSGSRWGQ